MAIICEQLMLVGWEALTKDTAAEIAAKILAEFPEAKSPRIDPVGYIRNALHGDAKRNSAFYQEFVEKFGETNPHSRGERKATNKE